MKYINIRIKLVILIMATLIPIIIFQVINIQKNFSSSTEQKLKASEELATAVSKAFVNHIEQLWAQEFIIGEHITANINNAEEIQTYLDKLISADETAIKRLSWANPDGLILSSTRRYMIGESLIGRDYYKRVIGGEEKVLSDLVESYVDGTIVVPIVRGIKKDGKLMGILVYSADVYNLMDYIPNLNLHEGDVLSLIDRSGNIAYQNNISNISLKDRLLPMNAPAWKALKGETVRAYKDKSSVDDSYRIGVDYPIEEIGWAISINSDRDVVLEDANRQVLDSVIALLIVAIVSLGASIIFGIRMVTPLETLRSKANELKQGNLSVRTNITGFDEIAATAEAFDHMADSIEQYDKMKGQFFSNLSHELKTPINVIYSCIQLMESYGDITENKLLNVKVRKNIGVIRQNCYRLMRLIGNLIDLSRYDGGYYKINASNCNIVGIVEDISLSVVRYAEQKGINIVFDTDIEEKEIACDPEMIERIVLNLISNSLKFTETDGYIYINIYDNIDKIIISVRDTGVGIPEDKLSIIFERFRRVDSSLSRSQEGSGLGLTIVKSLVEAHDGRISVKSELGKGTEFTLELPVKVLPNNKQEIDIGAADKFKDTVKKIEIEFSDIYSIHK
jgi:signal transduction histidine kinase